MHVKHARTSMPSVGLTTLAAALALWAPGSMAQDLSYSGFASLVLGRSDGACVTGAGMATAYDSSCTRYIADWAHAGVYTPSVSAAQESRLGLQAVAKFTPAWSLTGQITSRPNDGQHLNLEWLFATYKATPELSLQLGRKRLPLYYYSDFQDVGYAYNTIRPSPDVYGWDVVNYNGASLSYAKELGEWSLHGELLAGTEDSRDNPYQHLMGDATKNIEWHRIWGATLEVNRDWFTGRLSYVQSDFRQIDRATNTVDVLPSGLTGGSQSFLGLALNADVGDWIVRTEFGTSDRKILGYKATFYLATVGYRMGKFTLTGGVSGYRETTPYPQAYTPLSDESALLALRYEVHKGGALKLQWDRLKDQGTVPFAGSARALTASYDVVF